MVSGLRMTARMEPLMPQSWLVAYQNVNDIQQVTDHWFFPACDHADIVAP